MRSILIFYLTRHLLFDDAKANAQYSSYAALIYLLPLMGSVLADRWPGTCKAVGWRTRACWRTHRCRRCCRPEATP